MTPEQLKDLLERVQNNDRTTVIQLKDKQLDKASKYLVENNCQVEIRMDYRTGGYELRARRMIDE